MYLCYITPSCKKLAGPRRQKWRRYFFVRVHLAQNSILLISLTITTTENDRLNVYIEIHNFFEWLYNWDSSMNTPGTVEIIR